MCIRDRDYTVQSLDELDELFFQRVYERHYGFPWCIGETEQLKIRESTEEDVEKLLAFFTDEEARRWLFEGEGKLFSEEEQREKLKAYVRNRYGFYGYGFYSVLWKMCIRDSQEAFGSEYRSWMRTPEPGGFFLYFWRRLRR